MPKRSISITETHNEWLKAQVASGQYRSESEVISDLIREQQQRDTGIEAIRLAMVEDERMRSRHPNPRRRQNSGARATTEKRLANSVITPCRIRLTLQMRNPAIKITRD